MEKMVDEARLAEQEAGLSTLFLACGFLEWYESDDSDKPLFAPLLLLPARIERQTIRGKDVYFVATREGAAENNISLQKLIEKEFSRALPEFESDDPDAVGSIENYLAKARDSIDGLKRWQVRRWMVLGHFAFSRIAMYEDTKPDKWEIHPTQTALLGPLLKGYEEQEQDDAPAAFRICEDYHIDAPEIERLAPFLIQDADASQHSALVDVMKSKNLVLQGPPGTGKSQTITNIIANALADGKRVLFLSEKQAALDVVKRRLDTAGLGEFCLELHSDKSSPKAVITNLDHRHKLGIGTPSKGADVQTDATWSFTRAEISQYVAALHAEAADGATPFQLIWKSIRGRTIHNDVQDVLEAIGIPTSLLEDPQRLAAVSGRLEIFAASAQSFADAHGRWNMSPWCVTPPQSNEIFSSDGMLKAIADLRQATSDLAEFFDNQDALGIASAAEVDDVVAAEATLPEPPDMSIVGAIASLDLDELSRGLALQSTFLEAAAKLAALPLHNGVDAVILSRASQLVSFAPTPELLALTPSELYRRIEQTVSRNRLLLDSVKALDAPMLVLGIEGTAPIHIIGAVATAIVVSTTIDGAHRPWIGATYIDEQAFIRLNAQLASLVQEEIALRDMVPDYGDQEPWPAAGDLNAAAAILRKTGLAKVFGTFSGKSKTAKSILERFRFQQSPAAAAEILDRIADHVRTIELFEQSQEGASKLGPAWRGLETPFDEIDAGIQWRRYIQSELEEWPAGGRIASAMFALSPEQLAALSEHEAVGRFYLQNMETFQDILDGTPINAALSTHSAALASSERLLELDPERALAGADLPLASLAEIDAAYRRLTGAKSAVDDLPLAVAVRALAPGKSEITKVIRAIAWARAVRTTRLPATIADALLSADGSRWRDTLREVARGYSSLQSRRATALTMLEQFRLKGLEAFEMRPLIAHLDSLLAHGDALAEFLSLAHQRGDLIRDGLDDFLNATDAANLAPSRLSEIFEASVARLRAQAWRRTSTPISRHTGNDLDAKRKTFADRDRKKILTDRETVKARLLTNQPPFGTRTGPIKAWTQMYLLKHEFQKERHLPVRKLLERAGDAIMSLKPCFMMSPLSLAKFLPPGAFQFDLLVIDEASQMKPEDALGAMLRSKQMVVVGDTKQLPPTSFFDRTNDNHALDDEDVDEIDDESILERCQKVFEEVRRLKWHYRSRCESLIRFSNENFYEGNLITFPAAKPGSFSIDLVRVDGACQASFNVIEANRVAEEAVEFMRHFSPNEETSIPTLGIVAVNVKQRDLIGETLRRLSTDDELVSCYMEKVERKGEPLFIKNLENVQGDERDFIFISMTYGREPGADAMKQRFGPINSKQGHRRLNVLFSRARVRIGLFASFGSADIKPTDSSKEGVHILKRYLEYAETRGRAAIEAMGGEPDSDFEIEVSDRLKQKGYLVDTQIGVSGFKIDLGVRHPDHPELFLAGIECDGASYHSSKSARDRDRLREEVLRGLGWQLLRVWSTDWFDNANSQIEKLDKQLKLMRERPIATFRDYSLKTSYISPINETGGVESEFHSRSNLDDSKVPASWNFTTLTSPVATSEHTEDAAALLNGSGPLTEVEAHIALTHFRESVIRVAASDWQPHRSILRDSMIETFLRQRIADPDGWFTRVPQYLRSGTDPVEKRLYLERICAIVDRVEGRAVSSTSKRADVEFKLTKSPSSSEKKSQGCLPLSGVAR